MTEIGGLYDVGVFEQAAHGLLRELSSYLRGCASDPGGLPWVDPAEMRERARKLMELPPLDPQDAAGVCKRVQELGRALLESNNPLHSPHYMGHQVAPPMPLPGFFEALGSTANQPSGIYEMGPLPSAIERVLFDKLGSYLGWEGLDYDAIATHGGSLANLTAILAARNVRVAGSWQKGVAAAAGGRKPAVVCSAESHYSISRAVAVVGLGADQVIKAPIDSRRKMDDSRLAAVIDEAAARGLDVFCVVGSACATPTGAFDRLEPIGRLCRERGIWFHVDAAHGGGLLLSGKHRELLKGIELADSVTWDAHKMMFVPALCTFVFYRDKKHSYQAFDQDAPYLFSKDANPTLEYDSAVRTLECTKRPIVLALWAAWSLYGPGAFEQLVDRTLGLTREFYEMLKGAQDFEPVHEPEANILCFRYVPDRALSAERLSDLQVQIRRKLVTGGDFYITSTRIDGTMVLRVTLMNSLTQARHLEALMQTIRKMA